MQRKRLGDTPAKPPEKKRKKGGRKRTRYASLKTSTKIGDRIEREYQLDPEKVNNVIIECRGVLTDAAEQLGVRRQWLRNFIADRKSCAAIYKECREEMGDVAEKKLYELIDAGHFPAITFYLSTVHKGRGYGLGRNARLPGEAPTINQIETVNIVAVPAGTYLTAEDIKALAPAYEAPPVDVTPVKEEVAA